MGDTTYLLLPGLAQKPLKARRPVAWGSQETAHAGAHIPAHAPQTVTHSHSLASSSRLLLPFALLHSSSL